MRTFLRSIGNGMEGEHRLLHIAEANNRNAPENIKNPEETVDADKERAAAIDANAKLVAGHQKEINTALDSCRKSVEEQAQLIFMRAVRDATMQVLERSRFAPNFTSMLMDPRCSLLRADAILHFNQTDTRQTIAMKQAIATLARGLFQQRFTAALPDLKKTAASKANAAHLQDSHVQLEAGIKSGQMGYGGIENMAVSTDYAKWVDLTPKQEQLWNTIAQKYTSAFNAKFGRDILEWKMRTTGNRDLTVDDVEKYFRTSTPENRAGKLSKFKDEQIAIANRQIRTKFPDWKGRFYNEILYTDAQYIVTPLQFSPDGKLAEPEKPLPAQMQPMTTSKQQPQVVTDRPLKGLEQISRSNRNEEKAKQNLIANLQSFNTEDETTRPFKELSLLATEKGGTFHNYAQMEQTLIPTLRIIVKKFDAQRETLRNFSVVIGPEDQKEGKIWLDDKQVIALRYNDTERQMQQVFDEALNDNFISKRSESPEKR